MARQRKASASQILRWLRCPRNYYYCYKEHIKEPKTIPLVRGTLVHSVIEKMYEIDLKDLNIHKGNYKEKLPMAIMNIHERLIDEPGNEFGKCIPSPKELFCELTTTSADDEIETTRLMISNFIDQYMKEIEQWTIKFDNFPKAFRETSPTFRELHIDLGFIQAYLDQVYELDGSVVIADLKTSTLNTGRLTNSDSYIPNGVSGINNEYVLQLFIYAWMYWKKYDVYVDWLVLKYVKYGYEFTIPFKFMDRDAIFDAIEALIEMFLEHTDSSDINTYRQNIDGEPLIQQWDIHNTFCSCRGSRFEGRGYCYYDRFCNQLLEPTEESSSDSVIIDTGDSKIVISAWLADKKGLSIKGYVGVIEKETEKALLVHIAGIQKPIWIPKSQITYK